MDCAISENTIKPLFKYSYGMPLNALEELPVTHGSLTYQTDRINKHPEHHRGSVLL